MIGVHEMHGRMHPNYRQITIVLVVDLCSSLAYFMITQSLPIAGKLPIKTLVAIRNYQQIIIQTGVHVHHRCVPTALVLPSMVAKHTLSVQ